MTAYQPPAEFHPETVYNWEDTLSCGHTRAVALYMPVDRTKNQAEMALCQTCNAMVSIKATKQTNGPFPSNQGPGLP